MRSLRPLTLLAIALLLAVGAPCQLRWVSLPRGGQLPEAHVRRIMQDSHGYLWYATMGGGLARDNAYCLDVFRPSREDGLGAASDRVLCLAEDKLRGGLWFGTEGGLFYVDPSRDFALCEPDTSLRREAIHALCPMRDGTLWVSLRGRLLRMNGEGKRLGEYPMLDSLGHPLVVPCMIESRKGELVGCASWNVGVFRHEERGDSVEFLPWGVEGSPQWMVEDSVNDCYWVATWGEGIVKYQGRKAIRQGVYTEGGGDGIAYHVSMDRGGRLWVCGTDRLVAYSTAGGELSPATCTRGMEGKLRGITVETTECDLEGNVWVASLSPTSFVLSPSSPPLRRIALSGSEQGLGSQSLPERVAASGGDVWVYVTRLGLVCLSGGKGEGEGKAYMPAETGGWSTMGTAITAPRSPIRPEGDAGLWACRSKDLCYLWREGGKVISQRVSYLGQDVNAMLDDGRGGLWIGGTERLQRFDIEGGHPETVVEGVGGISQLTADSLGHVYCLASEGGVVEVGREGEVRLLRQDHELTCLTASPEGTLYASGTDGAIYHLTPGDSLFELDPSLTPQEGGQVMRLTVDALGHLWVMTANLLREYDLRSGAYRSIGRGDKAVNLDAFSCLETYPSGVVSAGPGAVCLIPSDPSLALHTSPTPQAQTSGGIRVAAVSYQGERHLMVCPEELRLPARPGEVAIEITTLDYLGRGHVRYAYRTSPRGEWHRLPKGENTIRLRTGELPPRYSRLEVRAEVEGTINQPPFLVLRLWRAPRLWESLWFLVLMGMAVIALVVVGGRAISRRRRGDTLPTVLPSPVAAQTAEPTPSPETAQTSETTPTPKDEFLLRAEAVVEAHLREEAFDVDALASEMGLSRSALYRKLEALGADRPALFIRNIRLRNAARLLTEGRLSVSEVAYAVGFSYVSYFCRCFKDMYGVQPGQYHQG